MATAGTTLQPTPARGWRRIAMGGLVAASLVGVGFAAGRTSTATPTTIAPGSDHGAGLSIEQPDRSTFVFDHSHRIKWG